MNKSNQFEQEVRQYLSKICGFQFTKQKLEGVPKEFDLVSPDGQFVGDAKYYTLVRGVALPPAKFATIAEYVWLMEKTKAKKKFLVFGNDRQVPTKWLKKYGALLSNSMKFFYFDEDSDELSLYNREIEDWAKDNFLGN